MKNEERAHLLMAAAYTYTALAHRLMLPNIDVATVITRDRGSLAVAAANVEQATSPDLFDEIDRIKAVAGVGEQNNERSC